ncbi:MAG: helix-turn-helix transcriptional regulator [Bacteroidetes bacterium]|nr:helix-turn-helix transcriptional regulator [Bacteroidota bacterium]
MIKLEYTHTSYNELFLLITKNLRLKVKNDVGIVPSSLGEGMVQLINLYNGLDILILDYKLKEDVVYHRRKSNRDVYIMRIDDNTEQGENAKSALFFSHISKELYFMTPANTRVKNIYLSFNKEWLFSLLSNEPQGELLFTNVLMKAPLYYYELIDSEYRRLTQEIMQAKTDPNFKEFKIYNRVMTIVERFFVRYYKKISQTHRHFKISSDEMQRLKTVEAEILKDFSFTPPNITQLSRMAAMSPSKLKLVFKEVFGMPVYQYYQKHRLQKGKAMLITKKYTIKQVATELGYIHVKDFSRAFQKHFDQLPEEIIN